MNFDLSEGFIVLAVIILCIFYSGEPDLHDALICNLTNSVECF